MTSVRSRAAQEFFQERVIIDLGVQGTVWVREGMKNGGKDLPDRQGSREKAQGCNWSLQVGDRVGAKAGKVGALSCPSLCQTSMIFTLRVKGFKRRSGVI